MNRVCRVAAGVSVLLMGAAIVTACSSGCLSLFAPSARVVDNPIVDELDGDPEGASSADHAIWAELLDEHVDYDSGRVDYAGLKADVSKLDAYLDQLAELDLEPLGDDAELAVLINAYNAFTLKLVVEHYPDIETIKEIDSPWKSRRWTLGGHKLSLDDIEHGLIRPLYRDSRIHFAVNCASVGCPPLAPWPYEAAKIDDQLDQAARRTLGDSRYARATARGSC